MARAFRAALGDFEPGTYSAPDCVELADELAATEKACAAARLLVNVRAVDAGAHKAQGVADPVAWVARQGGTTGRDARQALELARALESHPETKEALLAGAVSVAQAIEITAFSAEAPGREHELLEVAKAGDLTKLRDETRDRRLNTTKPEELHRRRLAAGRFRHWRDALGMIAFEGSLPPETGIPFVNRIERAAARLHREARRNGSTERFETHAADALLALCVGGSGGVPSGARVATGIGTV